MVSQIITSEAFDELIYSFHDCVDHADMLTRSMTAISNEEYKNGEIPSLSHLLEAIKYERYAFIEICTKILDELVPYQEKVNAANAFLYECEEQLEKEWYAREDTQKYKDELTRTKKKMEGKHGISAPKEE